MLGATLAPFLCSCTNPATVEPCAGVGACSLDSAWRSLPLRWRSKIAPATSVGWRVEPRGGPCWAWLGSDSGNGYGKTKHNGRDCMAHRAIYEATRGPVPRGLVLDHLCRFRLCVNPFHVEPATVRDNTLSGDAVLFRPRAALLASAATAPILARCKQQTGRPVKSGPCKGLMGRVARGLGFHLATPCFRCTVAPVFCRAYARALTIRRLHRSCRPTRGSATPTGEIGGREILLPEEIRGRPNHPPEEI